MENKGKKEEVYFRTKRSKTEKAGEVQNVGSCYRLSYAMTLRFMSVQV